MQWGNLLHCQTKVLIISPANKGIQRRGIYIGILPVFSAAVGGQIAAITPPRQSGTEHHMCCSRRECVCVFKVRTHTHNCVSASLLEKQTHNLCIKLLSENFKQFSSSGRSAAFIWNGNCFARWVHFIILHSIVCLYELMQITPLLLFRIFKKFNVTLVFSETVFGCAIDGAAWCRPPRSPLYKCIAYLLFSYSQSE